MIEVERDTAFAQRLLDVLALRSKTALHNVANQNVPGFKRYEVRFEDALRQAETRGEDAAAVQPELRRDTSGEPGQNNVVLLEELAVLGKTQLLHDVMTRRIGSYFGTLNKAIFGK